MSDATPAPLPVDGPTSLARVKAHLEIPVADLQDDDAIEVAVAAVNALVRAWPCSTPARGHDDWDTFPNVVLGATMLSARIHRRRASPDGVATFGADGPLYVRRNDPDVGLLLGLGEHARPAVG